SVVSVDATGAPARIVVTSQNGRAWSRTRAEITADDAHIVRETPAGQWSNDVRLPSSVRFDDGGGLLRSWDPAASPELEFENFSIGALGVERVVISATAPSGDGPIQALRLRYQGDALMGVARLTIAHGEIVDVARPMFGATMHIRAADRATALAPLQP